MQSLLKDIKYSIRSLASRPMYVLIVLFTLALGISVTATMFTLVNTILIKPLPAPNSDKLMVLSFENQTKSKVNSGFNYNLFLAMEKIDGAFESMGFWMYDQTTLTQNNSSKPLSNLKVTQDYFEVLSVQPVMGRWFNSDDRGKNSVLISHDLWLSDFQKSDSILGRSILLDETPHTIIGVMPKGFNSTGDLGVKLWNLLEQVSRPGSVIARLKPKLSLDSAQNQLASFDAILNQNRSDKADVWKLTLTPMLASFTERFKPALILLLLSVLAVFFIAVLNVINLTFAHYANRAQELAIRIAVGATRKRMIRQLLVENLSLAFAGGTVGLLIAAWGIELVKYLAPAELPRVHELTLDMDAVAIIAILIIVSGVVTTLVPAFSLVNPKKLSQVLKSAGRKVTSDKKSNRVRRALVSLEVGVAVVLLIGAGLMLRSYTLLLQQAPGFKAENIVAGHVWLPDSFGSDEQEYLHWQKLLQALGDIQGVESVAATSSLPMMPTGIDFDVIYSYNGAPESVPGEEPQAAVRSITSNYFKTLQIPILQGREYDERDTASSAPVVIINQTLADKLWSEETILGRELILPTWMGGGHRIVGVVDNVKHRALRSSIRPEFYLPYAQRVYPGMSFILKAKDVQQSSLFRQMTNVTSSLAVTAPMIQVDSLERLTINSISTEKLMLNILAIFSGLALFLASIGVYGISDNMVNQRTNEIGIRMALGARPRTILRWVLWDSSRPVVIGALIGLMFVAFMGSAISALLYGVTVWDPLIYVIVPLTLMLVGVGAAWTPAKKATRIHPQEALYSE